MKKKIIIAASIVLLLGVISYFYFSLKGNPISEAKARKECLEYYENAYHEKFTVYSSEYNLKLPPPHYHFEMGPVNNKNIRFGTGGYCQGMSDYYGGILASAMLTEDVTALLKPKYNHLHFSVSSEETPWAWSSGTAPDYFETNPSIRLKKNCFYTHITLPDAEMNESELTEIATNMAKDIENQLSYEPPNLQLFIVVNSSKPDEEPLFLKDFSLFDTTARSVAATSKICEDVTSLLKPEYGYLNFAIDGQEHISDSDHLGEMDLLMRLKKNHYDLEITWINGGLNKAEMEEIAAGMFEIIESQLPYETTDLRIKILVLKSTNQGEIPIFEKETFLFKSKSVD